MNFISKILPFFDWIKTYNANSFKGDLSAGITVGIMLIPQGMAYAMIAGLPPVYGLYASLVPLVVYSFLGTSRQLSVGPVAMDSLFVAATVSIMAIPFSDHYIELAILMALMIGVLQFVFGVIRLGFLVNFLSKPVITGFTTAAALIIGLNQVKYLFGTEIPRNNQLQYLITDIVDGVSRIHPLTMILGIIGIVILIALKKMSKKIPSALVLVLIGTSVAYFVNINQLGVAVVEFIPSGLPSMNFPEINQAEIMTLLPAAFALALIAFMEAISVAKAIEEKHDDYKINPNQELIALGASNIIGSIFSAYPVTGGFSRTAVNNDSGAKTGIAGIISAVVILLTLLFLTDLFYFLPKVVLASIILVAVTSLIDLKAPKKLWQTDKKEFFMYVITLLATCTIGIQQGIGIGVLMSLVLLIYKVTNPHMAIIGKIPGTEIYRNIERFEDVDLDDEIMIVRFDARLFYANMNYFRDRLITYEEQKGTNIKAIIIDGSGINSIDSSAIDFLKRMIQSYDKRGVEILFSGLKGPVRDSFKKNDIFSKETKDHFFVNIENAEKFVKGEKFEPKTKMISQSND